MARVYRSAHGATTISRPASRLNCPRHPAPRVATSRMGGVPAIAARRRSAPAAGYVAPPVGPDRGPFNSA